ncbi:uncharacterized protein GJ701_010138 isoform 1-T1 [Geothlypis trichas]
MRNQLIRGRRKPPTHFPLQSVSSTPEACEGRWHALIAMERLLACINQAREEGPKYMITGPISRMLCNMVLVICFKDTVMRYRDWHISKKSFLLGKKYCKASETRGDNMTQGILSFPWHILEDQISHRRCLLRTDTSLNSDPMAWHAG